MTNHARSLCRIQGQDCLEALREVATVPELRSGTAFPEPDSMAGRSRLWTTWRAFSRAARALCGWTARRRHERETGEALYKIGS